VFVRRKKNKSGSVSIQIIDISSGKPVLKKTVGSAKEWSEVEKLFGQAESLIPLLTGQHQSDFQWQQDKEFVDSVLASINIIYMLGPELILGKLFDQIGFDVIREPLFRSIVLARLVYPGSKLKTVEYLLRYQGVQIEVDAVYRFVDKLDKEYKELLQQISFAHTQKILGQPTSVVFYDVTTLYFEAADEDDLRKTGFSKDGKHKHLQILLGLLVSTGGYPLAHKIFEGNKFEGHTMLPVIKLFQAKYALKDVIVIADAGLISAENIKELKQQGYRFIVEARIKNEVDPIKAQILSLVLSNGQSTILRRSDNTTLVVSYSVSRAKRDEKNRNFYFSITNFLLLTSFPFLASRRYMPGLRTDKLKL